MKTIAVTKVPGILRQVVLEDDGTIQDALNVYASDTGEATEGYDIRTASGTASATDRPADGTKVYLVAKVKGNK